MILECKQVNKYFGGLAALENVEFHINEGEILGLIGPNGAGKTTLFNVITGFIRPSSGFTRFKGKNITGMGPHEICRLGISRTFQIVKPFANLDLLNNVLVGVYFGRQRKESERLSRERAMDILKYTGLLSKKEVLAKNLTISEQKRLEIAKALATEPDLLLLDEVMAGLNPVEISELLQLIRNLRDEGITIFMIEHVMRAIMNVSDRIIVLNLGKKIAEGSPREVANDRVVIGAYLGEKYIF